MALYEIATESSKATTHKCEHNNTSSNSLDFFHFGLFRSFFSFPKFTYIYFFLLWHSYTYFFRCLADYLRLFCHFSFIYLPKHDTWNVYAWHNIQINYNFIFSSYRIFLFSFSSDSDDIFFVENTKHTINFDYFTWEKYYRKKRRKFSV